MTEDLTATSEPAGSTPLSTARTWRIVQFSYTTALILMTVVLLISRTDLAQLWANGWLFLLLLVINTICTELAIPLSS